MSTEKHLHPGAGLSAEEVVDVRARLVAGEGVKSIARQHGVGHATVSRIKSGLSYRSLGADHVGRPGAKVRGANGIRLKVIR